MEVKHETILMRWIIDLNNGIDHLNLNAKQTTFEHKLRILTQGWMLYD